jgi:hypothetical protein
MHTQSTPEPSQHGGNVIMQKTTSRAEIKKLDNKIKIMVEKALSHSATLRFSQICSLNDLSTIQRQKYPGLYFIEVRVNLARHNTVEEWASWFQDRWDNDGPRMHYTPGIKAGRIKEHKRLRAWMPFYLGIRKTTVAQRVMEHIRLPAKANTGGMKLASRKKVKLREFRLRTIRLELHAYDSIMPIIERAMRKKLHPIAGN